ncbi:MAG: class I SAM-dependent methyltransferase [Verrucomicrobiales bacterium]
MDHSIYRQERAEDIRRLKRLLERALSGPAEFFTSGKEGEIAILDMACGACDEAEMLSQFFSSRDSFRSGPATRVSLVGTDVRQRELDEARERFRSAPGREFLFLAGDASRLDQHRQLREKFDVVFFRHQNLFNGRPLWQRIFEQGLGRLDDEGVVVITSYFDREHIRAINVFRELGAEFVRTLPNPESRHLELSGKSVDRHVAVFRKPRRQLPLLR